MISKNRKPQNEIGEVLFETEARQKQNTEMLKYEERLFTLTLIIIFLNIPEYSRLPKNDSL